MAPRKPLPVGTRVTVAVDDQDFSVRESAIIVASPNETDYEVRYSDGTTEVVDDVRVGLDPDAAAETAKPPAEEVLDLPEPDDLSEQRETFGGGEYDPPGEEE